MNMPLSPPISVNLNDWDARSRKRLRDKENQRQKRLRERTHVAGLEERNEVLEKQLLSVREELKAQVGNLQQIIHAMSQREGLGRHDSSDRFRQQHQHQQQQWDDDEQVGNSSSTERPIDGDRSPMRIEYRSSNVSNTDGLLLGGDFGMQMQTSPENHNQSLHAADANSTSATATVPGPSYALQTHNQYSEMAEEDYDHNRRTQPLGVLDHARTGSTSALPIFHPSISNLLTKRPLRDSEPVAHANFTTSPHSNEAAPQMPITHISPTTPTIGSDARIRVVESDANPFLSSTGMRLEVPIDYLSLLLSKPEWQRLPMHSPPLAGGPKDVFLETITILRQHPDMLAACDEEPKALDLLFGGSSNELANAMVAANEDNPSLRPEKFGIAWLCYLYNMWRINPSLESYNRIPDFFRPSLIQLVVPHHPILDYILWPQLRENFIRHGDKYCCDEVFGLLACALRIRNQFNSAFILRSKGEEPRADPIFVKKILSPDGWAIMEDFWTFYPELVAGMDPAKVMIRESELLPRS